MADKVLCEKSDLVAVANAIRSKNGTTNTYKVNQLASAVENISSSGSSMETVSLRVKAEGVPMWIYNTCYAQGADNIIEINNFGTYTVLKNSLFVSNGGGVGMSQINLELLYVYEGFAIFKVLDNATIGLS